MTRYARGTTVSIESSRAEIESILRRYGASAFGSAWSEKDGQSFASIEFIVRDCKVRFNLPLPDKNDKAFTMTSHKNDYAKQRRTPESAEREWEQACRQRWRALTLSIKAKLEAVECGITQFEAEFLAQIVNPETRMTIGEHFIPRILAKQPLGLPAPMEDEQ